MRAINIPCKKSISFFVFLLVEDVFREIAVPYRKYADDSQLNIAFYRSLRLSVMVIEKFWGIRKYVSSANAANLVRSFVISKLDD